MRKAKLLIAAGLISVSMLCSCGEKQEESKYPQGFTEDTYTLSLKAVSLADKVIDGTNDAADVYEDIKDLYEEMKTYSEAYALVDEDEYREYSSAAESAYSSIRGMASALIEMQLTGDGIEKLEESRTELSDMVNVK